MPDDPAAIPGPTPSNYQRTTGGNLQWKAPTVERLQQMLAGYEVIEILGMGGMGAVYKARQISLDRLVAIKILPPEAAGVEDANFVERFRNEARTMARMNHPAIVSVYDFGETSEGQLYIVMEFVDGTDVSKMILSQGKLPAEHALAITAHVCDALQYAHTHGVIHRDIKPANVLINMEGAVKVADFGLAKAADAGQGGLTKTNMAMGTPDFVAPEALIVGMNVDGRADLYAVGVMLYNMLTGNVPRGMFRMPSTTVKTDPRFDQIITRSMEMDREMRYQTAFDIRKDLDVILTIPLVEAGGQSSAAIPKQQLPQKPMSKGPQKLMSQSARVPVRSSPGFADVAEVIDPGLPGSMSRATKKTSIGPIIGIAATVVIGAGLFFLFKPKPPILVDSATPVASAPEPVKSEHAKQMPAPQSAVPSVLAEPKTTTKSPPLPPGIAKQTLDLLALTDPVQDRVTVPGMIGRNEWTLESGALIYKSDGMAGKIAAPVALNCRDYEIELRAERLSGTDRIHMDVPLGKGRILPLVFNGPGRQVINEKEGKHWPAPISVVHVTVRVMRSGDGSSDSVIIQRKDNGETLADWTGSMDILGKAGEAHPSFPGQPVASIFLMKDTHAVKTWTLRVFDGEAKVLREAAVPSPTIASTPAAPVAGIVNLIALVDPPRDMIEGDWKLVNGELKGDGKTEFSRIAFKVPVPEEYDFRIGFTRSGGNKAVAQHVPFGGSDVMWLMGGFGNKVSGLEQVGGKAGINNPTTVPGGLENDRRYQSVVKVRRDRIQVELDGKLVMEHKSDGSDLSVFEKWKFPDPKKLGVGCQQDTVFHSIELIPFTAASVGSLASVMPPTTAPNLKSQSSELKSNDPRLAQLATGFKARYESDAQRPFATALAALNQSYVINGIGRARTVAQKKGALNEVTTLDAEKARILKNEALPPADLESLPESLKTLRATYRGALAKLEADRAQKAAPLYDLYLGALDAYIADLTKANKIDEAQKVKTLRDEIAEQKPQIDAGAATAPAVGTARNGSKSGPNNGEDSATGGRGSRWYEAARWVVSVGGTMRVEKNGNQVDVRSDADIPAGRFAILSVDIGGNPKSQNIRDDDFTRLSGFKELTRLYLNSINVTDAAFAFLPTTPALTYLVLAAVPVTDGVLTHIAPLKYVTELHIQDTPQFTGAGLERSAALPNLKLVWFSNSGFNDAGAKALTGAKNLDQAFLESTAVTDEGVVHFGALTKLTGIFLSRCPKVHGTTLDTWENKASMRDLGLSSCQLVAEAFPVIGKFTNLTSLSLDDVNALNDETLPALAPLTKLTRISLSTSRVTGASFTALRGWTQLKDLSVGQGTSISAEGLAALVTAFPALDDLRLGAGAPLKAEDFRSLARLKMLTYLEAPLPTLDDATMIEIARIASLEDFYTVNSAITAKGIAALKPMKFLTKLTVEGCKNIDDSAVAALKDLKLLKEVNIKNTAITDESFAALKKALPSCNVIR